MAFSISCKLIDYMINTQIIGRIYHVVDKTTGEVVKVGSTIRSLEQRFKHYDYRRKYTNHFLKEVRVMQSSNQDGYEKGNAYCPFLWHLVASEHLEMLKMKTYEKRPFSNRLSPLYQKFFGFDGSEFGRLGGQSKSKNKLAHCIKQGRLNVENGHLRRICIEGGKTQGRRAAQSGQIAKVGHKQGYKNASIPGRMRLLGTFAMHNRWHLKRGIISVACKLCREAA